MPTVALTDKPAFHYNFAAETGRASLGVEKILQHLNGYGNDVGASPSRRDPYCAGGKLHSLGEDVADDRDHTALAIEHRRARGAMVPHEAVVSVIHLQQCCPREFVSIAVFYKPATSEPQTIARICEADDALLRGEGFQPYLQARCIAKWLPQFKQSDLLGMEARDMQDTDVNRLLAFARENLELFPVLMRKTHGHDNM